MGDWRFDVIQGDCLDVLRGLPGESVDALVTDPPAGVAFMGKDWDRDRGGRDAWVAWMGEVMGEVWRVLKPGAHGLVWALPRTAHWTAWALEVAGFEVRDVIVHVFGSGFPKSMDLSKAIDKVAGEEREVIGVSSVTYARSSAFAEERGDTPSGVYGDATVNYRTAPATDEARQWDGWGTALKPAAEHWILVRKPLSEKTIVRNVAQHGTGGINIDWCRIATAEWDAVEMERVNTPGSGHMKGRDPINQDRGNKGSDAAAEALDVRRGRFPSNLLLSHHPACRCVGERTVRACGVGNVKRFSDAEGDGNTGAAYGAESRPEGNISLHHWGADGNERVLVYECHPDCPVAMLDAQSGDGESRRGVPRSSSQPGDGYGMIHTGAEYTDRGGASRFFKTFDGADDGPGLPGDDEACRFRYCAKAARSEREAGLDSPEDGKRANRHPTVKPVKLMRYLCRLVTPPGGTVLDPFSGSGSTGVAAMHEGFRFVGIEQDDDYAAVARQRIAHAECESRGEQLMLL